MAKMTKTPVFFIATRSHKEPVVVNFYTKRGEPVSFNAVQRVKTKEGIHFYTKSTER